MKYILALGSNSGDRFKFLNDAVSGLNKIGEVIKKSSVYESAPYGFTDQLNFLNAVCVYKFTPNAFRLLRKIKQIEVQAGRTKSFHWGPREIDIDIIESEGENITSAILSIPHPDLENRDFVLEPLLEIEPEFCNRRGESLRVVYQRLRARNTINLYKEQW